MASMSVLRYLPRFRQAYQALPLLEARERWSRACIESFQLDRLNAVWTHAITHVPYYRTLARSSRLPQRFDSLREYTSLVPVLTKTTLRTRSREFLSERAEPGTWTRTGGSTGTPMQAFWSKSAHWEMLRSRYRTQAMWGVDLFDRQVFLWGHGLAFKPGVPGFLARCRQPIEDWLRNRLRLSVYRLGKSDLRGYLQQITRFRPALIYGFGRALYLLAREALETGFRLDSLRVIVMTGEPVYAHYVETIEQAFGVPATVEYGSSECGFLAGEWPDRTLRVREDVVYLETASREDGRYDILVSILNNPSFPLLRYALGDVTDTPRITEAQGFARLQNVIGRDNDLVLTRTGRILHSSRFEALFRYEIPDVRGYLIKQLADGTLRVSIEPDQPGQSPDRTYLQRVLGELVEGFPVEIQVVQHLPQTAAGKHRLILSEMDRTQRVCS